MIITTHIFIAILSIIIATYVLFKPSYKGLFYSYILVGSALISGTYLVVSTKSSILSACITGLIYTALVTATLIIAEKRLHKEKINK